MKSITAKELKEKLKNNEDFQLIDVREPYEYEDGAISNTNIPMDQVMSSIERISKEKQVIFYCQSGNRASAIIYMLEREYKLNNLYNLAGGYAAYMEEVYA